MADGEVLNRIDAHIAETKQHIARGNELFARFIEMHEDLRQFTREMLRRQEVALQEISREFRLEMRSLQAETRAGTDLLIELRDESRAQRGAILTLVDELREHGLGGRG